MTQLVAIGAQDAWLSGKPEVSFFRSTYKRHTNFSQTVERQIIQGNVSDYGMSTVRFERKGDLLGYVYLSMNDGTQSIGLTDLTYPSATTSWTDLITKVELLIGGQVVDDQDSVFSSKIAVSMFAPNLSKSKNQTDFYALRFFFCENWQSALPLISLQYHDVELRITWGASASSAYKDSNRTVQWECYANFVYLDSLERGELANRAQDMLIYQVQKSNPSNLKIQQLVMNHPIRFLASSNTSTDAKTGLFSKSNKIELQLNGNEIADYKFASPHFTKVPTYYNIPFVDANQDSLFVYSFSLDTSKLQPTGTLNFSRLDSAKIVSQTDAITDTIYACNYNILRIQNGMGGLMYAN